MERSGPRDCPREGSDGLKTLDLFGQEAADLVLEDSHEARGGATWDGEVEGGVVVEVTKR